jgi:hypothetical protein
MQIVKEKDDRPNFLVILADGKLHRLISSGLVSSVVAYVLQPANPAEATTPVPILVHCVSCSANCTRQYQT